MRQIPKNLSRATLLSLALFAAGNVFAAGQAQASVADVAARPNVFAKIGDIVITQEEFSTAFNTAARGKFYHGKPPEGEVALLQREVSDQMIKRILLEKEAIRQGLRPDEAEIQKTVQSYEKRYAGSDQWQKNREKMLPPLVARLGQDNLLSQIETTVRASAKPNEEAVRAYFAAHQDKFTEPEQLRVSVILFKVDPSAAGNIWSEANEKAQAIAKRVRDGEDFAALARENSGDFSAKEGGDMGYLHTGMLPEVTQEALSKLKNGETTEVVRLLQGMAVFRLTDRKLAKLHTFDEVKVRARDLAQREQSDLAWNTFVAELKVKTPVQIDQSQFLPLAEQSKAQENAIK